MSTSPFGTRRLRLLALATVVAAPLLAACNATPIVALNGGGGAGGSDATAGGSTAGTGGADGGDATQDAGDAG